MLKKHRRAAIGTVTASVATVAALGLLASPALAVSANEPVSGITSSSLALTASTGAAFATNFAPGNTATTVGALTLVDTNPTWTLQVGDPGSGAGHMVAAGTGCTGSESQLSQPLAVNISVPGSTVLPTGNGVNTTYGSYTYNGGSYVQVPAAASPATVASNNTGGQLLAADAFTTNYVQPIPSTDVMKALCSYSLTATYTLQ